MDTNMYTDKQTYYVSFKGQMFYELAYFST